MNQTNRFIIGAALAVFCAAAFSCTNAFHDAMGDSGGGGGKPPVQETLDPDAAVTGVSVTGPGTVKPDGQAQYAATVSGTGAFSSAVTWSVTSSAGPLAGGTGISNGGLLTVDINEALDTVLTVKAVSVADRTKEGTLDVTVSDYAITLSGSVGPLTYGYAGQSGSPSAITVLNTGNQGVTNLSAGPLTGTDAASFTLAASSIASLGAGESDSASIGIYPNDGLAAGTYSVTVNVTGNNSVSASLPLTLTVDPKAVSLNSVTATDINGTTASLDLTFSEAITGLVMDDINIDGAAAGGVVKNSLAGGGTAYTLTITVLKAGGITVSASNDNYAISGGDSVTLIKAFDAGDLATALGNDTLYPANTAGNPYTVPLTGNLASDFNVGGTADPLRDIFNALSGKYVVLDLSQCTGNIPDCSAPAQRSNKDKIVSVILSPSVTSIGNQAFIVCTGLTSIVLPAGVTTIGSGAFQLCLNLTSIELPAGVTTIGDGAFASCSGLAEVVCNGPTPPTLGTNVFYDTSGGLVIYVPDASVPTYQGVWSAYASQIQPISARP